MQTHWKNIKIEYPTTEQELVNLIIKSLDDKGNKILDFFGLENSKDFKIKIYETREAYIEHILPFLEGRPYQDWMTADTDDGNINMLPLKFVTQIKGRENDTNELLAYDACHEFVHICQQTRIKSNDCTNHDVWFWEALATNLGNPEAFDHVDNNFEKYNLTDLESIDYLNTNFETFNKSYPYSYLLGKFMLANYPHSQLLDYIDHPDKLLKDEKSILADAQKYFNEKHIQEEKCSE